MNCSGPGILSCEGVPAITGGLPRASAQIHRFWRASLRASLNILAISEYFRQLRTSVWPS